MNILHVIASVDPRGGGPIEGVIQQARQRSAEQFDVDIACLDAPEESFVLDCPVRTFALGESKPQKSNWRAKLPWARYGYQPLMVPWLKANAHKYDIVVVNGLWNYSTLAARRALVGGKTPYVVFTHGMLDPWFKKTYPMKSLFKQLFWLFGEGPLLNNANAVLFTTEDERIVSKDAFWPYRVRERVVGYGTSDISGDPVGQEASFRHALPALGDRRYLLFLSRIHEKKGCDLLIEAFASVANSCLDLDLVIAGPDQVGLRSKLEARACALGVDKRIHWPGMVTGDVKQGAYRGCEAFVLPSHQENFGIVVAEALAAAKPVLISNKVQIWREVDAGGAGMVEPDDVEGATRLLKRFLALSPDQKADMSTAARATFVAQFEISVAVETINVAFKEVARDRTA